MEVLVSGPDGELLDQWTDVPADLPTHFLPHLCDSMYTCKYSAAQPIGVPSGGTFEKDLGPQRVDRI